MRSSILIALSTALLVSFSTQASATTEISLVYRGGASGEVGGGSCEDDFCVPADPGDKLQFALIMLIDVEGMSAFSVDVMWDDDLVGEEEYQDELDHVASNTRGSLFLSDGLIPPGLIGFTIGQPDLDQESTGAQSGLVTGFAAIPQSPAPPYPFSLSFRIGRISFDVTESINDSDVVVGLFDFGNSVFGDATFATLTPNFGSFKIVATPEPGKTLLIASSLCTLLLLARRSKRDV